MAMRRRQGVHCNVHMPLSKIDGPSAVVKGASTIRKYAHLRRRAKPRIFAPWQMRQLKSIVSQSNSFEFERIRVECVGDLSHLEPAGPRFPTL